MTVDGGHLARRIEDLYANDAQIRAARPDEAVHAAVTAPGLSLARVVATAMTGYAERPALGARRTELVRDTATGRATRRLLPEFELRSYGEVWERARALAAAWHADGFVAGDFVTMLGFTGVDYTVLDLAAIHLGAVAVPWQSGAGLAQLRSILDETAPRIFAVDTAHLGIAVDAVLAGSPPRTLVVFDHHADDDDHRDALAAARTRLGVAGSTTVLRTLADLVEHGRHAPAAPLSEPAAGEDPLALLIYTSGSTGTPKGAMYTQRLVAVGWQPPRPLAAINVNFLPMSHIAARLTLNSALARGGTAYFAAAPDMSTLFEDIALVRPTEIFLVPRVCDLIQQRFRYEVEQRGGPDIDAEVLAEQVRTELREQFLGGRLLSVLCGSAPIAPDLRVFVESVLQLRLHDGYGSTETGGGVIFDTKVMRPPVLDYKLVDVPELGYFSTDKPYPRGELLLKTTTMIAGYYRRPEVTAEVFDADGFCRTGDVVAELAPDRLAYVDRRNNVLKLSQGEFVTVSRLEAIYAGADLVHQIYVYGSSERSYLLAVVVPTTAALALPAAELRGAVRASLHRAAAAADLEPFEIPRDFLLETEPFTVADGLLSGVGKLLRPKLKQRYGHRLEELYAAVARDQDDELQRLRRDVSGLSVSETVARAARAVLGCAPEDLRPDARLADLGGDSLAALSYSTLLRELLAVEVPVNVLLGPDSDLTRIADYIRREREPGTRRTDADAVHGVGATEIRAADLVLEKFLDAPTLAAAAALPATTAVNTVLITGANGYLGRFLLLSWLERLAPRGGTVICVVRGADAAAARARLDAAFDSDDELSENFLLLAKQALEVLPGDIGEPELGLPQPVWRRLAEQVDLIVHSAALVNHVLPYAQLFGPNVVGTAEILRLALTAKRTPVSYLSTVAVAAQGETFAEDGDVRVMSPVRRLDQSYANGYGNSKWAGEVLLREAQQRFGLPVAVFRSDMILAHSRYRGQLNVPDVFTRLLLSVLLTGLAPKSFYRTDSDGKRRRAHYDGLPADFVAAAITDLGAAATSGYRTYDVVNPHDDGISLDVFVDWLIAAGHRIDRIDDYDDWYARIDAALRALPEQQRKHTLLPLLHAHRRPGRALPGSALPADGFRAAVRAARIGPDHDIPHLGPELIGKYVRDLTDLGLVAPT
ncbi:oxidoreductase [Nocardia mangyaensis]|uniref:Carboxylic acid reductase n=1 Tax=Nocardia mangyaensis TaxID=2213200 RepID=A0A1J0VT15_9NOCA|nr:carboxylic acid reductase [Nocardia mangyaensis]APE35154.1 oxidoreductase [Nocardia mangyaensis]